MKRKAAVWCHLQVTKGQFVIRRCPMNTPVSNVARLIVMGIALLLLSPAPLDHTARAAQRPLSRILRRDLLRDLGLRPRRLARPRTVFRYTTREQAQRELRQGLRPGTHMTASGGAGRPLSPRTAQGRYGLPRPPQVRETIRLGKGTPVRPARVLGGEPGRGELTSPRRIPPEAIRRITPLKGGRPSHVANPR